MIFYRSYFFIIPKSCVIERQVKEMHFALFVGLQNLGNSCLIIFLCSFVMRFSFHLPKINVSFLVNFNCLIVNFGNYDYILF